MSYYDIHRSTPDPTKDPGITFTNQQNPEYQAPLQQPAGGFRTRDVNDDETVQGQLTGLLDSDSAYIQQARSQAARAANARGLMNSSLAAGAGQAAAIAGALPIAAQDAQTYAATHGANMDAENRYLLQQMQNNASLMSTRISAGAGVQAANIRAKTAAAQLAAQQEQFGQSLALDKERAAQQAAQFGQTLDWTKNQYAQDWAHQQALNDYRNRTGAQNYAMTSVWNTIMQNPTLWQSPADASGFANQFLQLFNQQYNQQFGVDTGNYSDFGPAAAPGPTAT